MIPITDLKNQYKSIEKDINQAILKVLNHGRYILGPEVFELEEKLTAYTGAKYCITCANGTDALQIALMAIGVSKGSEVIVPAFSYVSPAEVVKLLGGTPVYVDITLDEYNINADNIEKKITKNTKAIIPVSLFGNPAEFNKLNSLAEKYDIPIIEDAAQSFGSEYNGLKSCNLCLIGCTSFFPSKPLGCYGDGGAIFTSNEKIAQEIRQIARHGQTERYHHVRLGVNSRLDTIQAAILLQKLKILDEEIDRKEKIADIYSTGLSGLEGLKVPFLSKNKKSAWAQYTISAKNRDALKEFLHNEGISSTVHYPLPLTRQPAFLSNETVPQSDLASSQVLSIPMFGGLTIDSQNKIINSIKKIITQKG